MNCKFVKEGEYLVCHTCGFRLKRDIPPETLYKECIVKSVIQEQPKEYPSLFKMAGNAIKAGIDYVLSGFKNSKEEEVNRRLEICGGNEEKGIPVCPNFDNGRCTQCGCYTALKARLDSGSCPIGKW